MEKRYVYDNCPHCGLDLNGEDIYEVMLRQTNGDADKALESASHYGWTPLNKCVFRKELYECGHGARTITCPECHGVWTTDGKLVIKK